jgi:hypothetical protein
MASRESIAELAYQLWIARGQPQGSHEQDWLEAERQLGATQKSNGEGAGHESGSEGSATERARANDAASGGTPGARTSAGRSSGPVKRARSGASSGIKSPGAVGSAVKAARSRSSSNPPVDETDEAPKSAPHDIGEG